MGPIFGEGMRDARSDEGAIGIALSLARSSLDGVWSVSYSPLPLKTSYVLPYLIELLNRDVPELRSGTSPVIFEVRSGPEGPVREGQISPGPRTFL